MTNPNKAELRRLAEAATPGQWVTDCEEIGGGGKIVAIYVAHEDGGRIGQVFANCLVPTDAKCRANAAFMAAANPTAVLSLLDECESLHSAMGSPDEITAEPAGDYDALRKQFMSLLMLANSKAKQAQHWRSQSDHAMHQTLVQTAANVNAERDTNAMLTDALMKAEAERDQLRAEVEELGNDLAATEVRALKFIHRFNAATDLGRELRIALEKIVGEGGSSPLVQIAFDALEPFRAHEASKAAKEAPNA